MSIKKLLLSALLLTTTGFAYAQEKTDVEKNYIKIGGNEDIVLVAGEENNTEKGIVYINLENNEDWCAMQFDLYLPENVSVKAFSPNTDITNRLYYTYEDDFGNEQIDKFNVQFAKQKDTGAFRFVIYNGQNSKVADGEGGNKGILKFRLGASDKANTGVCYGYIRDAILAKSYNGDGSAAVTGFNAVDQESKFLIKIEAKVGAGGYGSFSWPRDVVFGDDVEVYVPDPADDASDGWLKLQKVSNTISKNTGVFIKGKGGATVNPSTLEEEVAKVSSSLGWTAERTYEAVSGTYALKTDANGKAGLHPVTVGSVIPKYKAYLNSTTKAKYISFGDTATSIDTLEMAEEEGDIYTLGGQKVQKTTMKGVYIKNGKKVVVK